jgi:hypothetical protein
VTFIASSYLLHYKTDMMTVGIIYLLVYAPVASRSHSVVT